MDLVDAPSRQLLPYLERVRWRLRLRDGLLVAQRTLWQAGILSVLVLLAGRIWPIEQPWKGALIPLAAWLLGVFGYALFRPMPPMRVARQADAELHLKERLSTSLALDALHDARKSQSTVFASFDTELVNKAHADALHAARAIDPAHDFPVLAQRRALLTAGGLLLVSMLLVWLPNPMDAVIAERKEVAREAARQGQQIEQLREQIQNAEEMSPEERDDLMRKLAELAQQLRDSNGDREEALANLSRLEQELRQQLDPKGGQRQAALEAMAAQLQAMAKAENPQIGDLEAAAEALEQLAEQMEAMSEEERAALAQQLSQMAARAAQAGDGSLAQALSAMAQAAQSGDMESAQEAAQRAADALDQARSDLAKQRALNQSLSQLQNSRRSMSGGRAVRAARPAGPGSGPGSRSRTRTGARTGTGTVAGKRWRDNREQPSARHAPRTGWQSAGPWPRHRHRRQHRQPVVCAA